MRRVYCIIISFIILICVMISYVGASGTSKPLLYPSRVGDHLVFEDGVLYHRPGAVPQLVVKGTHYQMGKQYGVLLRSELQYSTNSLERMLDLIARDQHLPAWVVKLYVRYQAWCISKRLPSRFIEEIKGVAVGSGISYQKILMVNMIYDINRLRGCTGVIWKNPKGEIYHGHTTDIGWGMDWPKTILVQQHPTGYHAFTTITWAGFLGTQTAYNDQGLCYSENTLVARKINSKGFSVNYLARIVMEECSSLVEAERFFDQYNTINGEALYFSDLRHGTASVLETTPLSPPVWAEVPLQQNVIWGINQYQNLDLVNTIQDNYQALNGINSGRQMILRDYFQKPHQYSLEEMIDLLRTSVGPEGKDYAKNPFLTGICNQSSLQMLIYDPNGKGVYLATGNYYASRNAILYYPDDFSQTPTVFKPRMNYDPAVAEAGRILNSVLSSQSQFEAWKGLAIRYPEEPFIHSYLGWAALQIEDKSLWAAKMIQAYEMEPDFPEYQLFAASAGYYQGNYLKVTQLLKEVDPKQLISPKFQALRLALLEKVNQGENGELAHQYAQDLNQLIQQFPPLKDWLNRFFRRIQP